MVLGRGLREEVRREAGVAVLRCIQCGKCTAGCPAAHVMDWGPRRVMRAVQLGLREELLKATTPWFYLFCFTCSARCPMELDIPEVMEWVPNSLPARAVSFLSKRSPSSIGYSFLK